MYGLEAINAANGWAMAFVGTLIVFSGLALLAFVISQLHKFLPLIERAGEPPLESEIRPEKKVEPVEACPTDLKVQAALFEPVIDELGASFPLAELYLQANEYNLPHPHLSITAFREATILVPLGEGIFTWDKERLTTMCKRAD